MIKILNGLLKGKKPHTAYNMVLSFGGSGQIMASVECCCYFIGNISG